MSGQRADGILILCIGGFNGGPRAVSAGGHGPLGHKQHIQDARQRLRVWPAGPRACSDGEALPAAGGAAARLLG